MKNFKSILCTSVLTLAMSSVAFGGDITSRAGDITSKPGDITSKPGDITSRAGDITSLTDEAYNAILGMLSGMLG
ncbi:MAG: hypothetical protein ACRD9S_01645 [Pyrinomonadaceae bacterium]